MAQANRAAQRTRAREQARAASHRVIAEAAQRAKTIESGVGRYYDALAQIEEGQELVSAAISDLAATGETTSAIAAMLDLPTREVTRLVKAARKATQADDESAAASEPDAGSPSDEATHDQADDHAHQGDQ